MTLVIDVTFNDFKYFIRDNAAYFWTETEKAFILVKPLSDVVYRCIIAKKNKEEDESFRIRELYSHTNKYVLAFTVDGKPIDGGMTTDVPTKGEIELKGKLNG